MSDHSQLDLCAGEAFDSLIGVLAPQHVKRNRVPETPFSDPTAAPRSSIAGCHDWHEESEPPSCHPCLPHDDTYAEL